MNLSLIFKLISVGRPLRLPEKLLDKGPPPPNKPPEQGPPGIVTFISSQNRPP